MGACAGGSITLRASVERVADIGATFVEVDTQDLLMTVVLSLRYRYFHGNRECFVSVNSNAKNRWCGIYSICSQYYQGTNL